VGLLMRLHPTDAADTPPFACIAARHGRVPIPVSLHVVSQPADDLRASVAIPHRRGGCSAPSPRALVARTLPGVPPVWDTPGSTGRGWLCRGCAQTLATTLSCKRLAAPAVGQSMRVSVQPQLWYDHRPSQWSVA
jgi:hypothetical protein